MMNNKVSLVTGANGGMGKAIATELARQGATVVIVSREKQGRSVPISYDEALQERVWTMSADLVGLEHSVSHSS